MRQRWLESYLSYTVRPLPRPALQHYASTILSGCMSSCISSHVSIVY